ncbi:MULTISPECIES: fimbria/pilus periplasmic chaperone [Brevundimonas]|uniref:fimbria/pilus periplasmic chaperone n=1 Tax=Brevundimonas TaxID=41275 RepID=UPI000F023366|nr:fimbria/pilus periplasmic chaperone [Brevundimonas lutea]
MFRTLIAAAALTLGLALSGQAVAQVGADLNISPKRVVFGPGERTATVYVFNQGDEPATYTVELVDRVMLPDGQIAAAADHPEQPIASALELVQHTPRRITLAPRQSQAIRVRARPGAGEAAERRTHLTVTALPPEDAGFTAEQAAVETGDDVALRVVALFSVSIPVIVRDGVADARAAIENPVFRPASEVGGQGGVALDLVRLGANSVYGDVEIRAGQGRDGRVVGLVRGVAVYPEVERRTVVAPLAEAVAPGEPLTLIYRDDDARPGETLATVTLLAP